MDLGPTLSPGYSHYEIFSLIISAETLVPNKATIWRAGLGHDFGGATIPPDTLLVSTIERIGLKVSENKHTSLLVIRYKSIFWQLPAPLRDPCLHGTTSSIFIGNKSLLPLSPYVHMCWGDLDGNAEFYETPVLEVTRRERNELFTLSTKRL